MTIETPVEAPKLKHFAVTQEIIGAFYEVYNELGHGFLESVYREAMIVALRSKNFVVEREKTVNVEFVAKLWACFGLTLVVDNCVVVELKCARTIDSNHEAQLLNYLKATKFEVGLLLNFGVKPQFRRMIWETARCVSQRASHESTRAPGSRCGTHLADIDAG
jgi:GxxExxY protein